MSLELENHRSDMRKNTLDSNEFVYTTYKLIPNATSVPETINGTFKVQLALKLFPEEEDVDCVAFKCMKGEDENVITYIMGFIQTQQQKPTGYFFLCNLENKTTIVDNVETTIPTITHVNCYKCTTGNVTNVEFKDYAIKHGNNVLFGFIDQTETTRMVIPENSFFLEGEHQPFSDLSVGEQPAIKLTISTGN